MVYYYRAYAELVLGEGMKTITKFIKILFSKRPIRKNWAVIRHEEFIKIYGPANNPKEEMTARYWKNR